MQLFRQLAFSLLLIPSFCLAEKPPNTSRHNPAESSSKYLGDEEQALEAYQQGLNYLLGRNGVERSTSRAASIFRALAERNWSSAQHMLGNMYMKGKGVEQNDLLAYKWLSLASKNNIRLAESIQGKRKTLFGKLQSSLSEEALQRVDTWIADWRPTQINSIPTLLTSQD